MPVKKCRDRRYPKGKFKIGSGKCVFHSKASAERAYGGYRASHFADKGRRGVPEFDCKQFLLDTLNLSDAILTGKRNERLEDSIQHAESYKRLYGAHIDITPVKIHLRQARRAEEGSNNREFRVLAASDMLLTNAMDSAIVHGCHIKKRK